MTVGALTDVISESLPRLNPHVLEVRLGGIIQDRSALLDLDRRYCLQVRQFRPYQFVIKQTKLSLNLTGIESVLQVRSTLSNRYGLAPVYLWLGNDRLEDCRLIGSYQIFETTVIDVKGASQSDRIPYSFMIDGDIYDYPFFPHLLVGEVISWIAARLHRNEREISLYSRKTKLDRQIALCCSGIGPEGIRVEFHEAMWEIVLPNGSVRFVARERKTASDIISMFEAEVCRWLIVHDGTKSLRPDSLLDTRLDRFELRIAI
jgi:hypothetical protein